jgi:hypothetical protein
MIDPVDSECQAQALAERPDHHASLHIEISAFLQPASEQENAVVAPASPR